MVYLKLNYTLLMPAVLLFAACSLPKLKKEKELVKHTTPEIEGNWWQVAGNPDLGEFTSPEQQPVDFGIWEAADGTWQIWSCIRKTNEKGHTRLFYRWEGDSITQTDWDPMGIAMRADTILGEAAGGMQAPYVIPYMGKYLMFYGDWNHICLAESQDGKQFDRVFKNNTAALFGDPGETNTRDPMVIRVNDQWLCYYTAHPDDDGAIYLRSSKDLYAWSESKIVSHGGSPGSGKLWLAECPHVVQYDGKYYLFRTYSYGEYANGKQIREPETNVYCSDDPENFGIDTDSLLIGKLPVAAPEIIYHKGKWYIAALMADLQGIRLARLNWIEK
jgi:hypothetical protein